MSHIYRYSSVSDRFELVQEVATNGARDWEAFALNGDVYLAGANYNGSYNLLSRIYRHSRVSGRFELMQEVPTSGAYDWEAFTVNGATYLAVANSGDGRVVTLLSRIYRYFEASGQFEVVQQLPTDSGHD